MYAFRQALRAELKQADKRAEQAAIDTRNERAAITATAFVAGGSAAGAATLAGGSPTVQVVAGVSAAAASG